MHFASFTAVSKISYKHGLWLIKESCLQDSPPAAGRFMRHLPFRRSAILPGRAFCVIGNSVGIPYYTKSPTGLDHTAAKRNYVAGACLENAFCKMCVTVCGKFVPDEGVVAGYDNRIRDKSPAKWGVQIAEMIFQTRSSNICNTNIII